MSLQTVIDKIVKLRRLATSSNVNEAANAAAAAEKLIQEHRLSEAELESQSSETPHETPEESPDALDMYTKLATWRLRLMSTLARTYGVSLWQEWTRIKPHPSGFGFIHGAKMRMVGRKSDVEILKYQYAYLTLEIERLAQKAGKARGRTWANNFRIGAVDGIADAMYAVRKAAAVAPTSSSAAMVLASRLDEAHEMKKRLHPDLKTSRRSTSSRYDEDARDAGRRAGKSIHQGGALSANATRRLGS